MAFAVQRMMWPVATIPEIVHVTTLPTYLPTNHVNPSYNPLHRIHIIVSSIILKHTV